MPNVPAIKLPNVQSRMYSLLSDGLPHTREELHACLWDDQGAASNIAVHLTAIRKALRPFGHGVICEQNGHVCYRLVRFIANS